MKYLNNGPFSVNCAGDQDYRDRWDAIFAKSTPDTDLDVTGCIVENYEEGEPAPSWSAENIDASVKVFFTEEDERQFEEAMSQPCGENEFVPLRAVRGTIQQQVREFHRVYGQPILNEPMVPPDDRVRLRLRLIAEEFFELLAACEIWPEGDGVAAKWLVYDAIEHDLGTVDIIEVADALADIAYVVEGAALEFGIDSEIVLQEVQRSNMSKLGADGLPVFNADGKVTKGPNYSPPNVKKALGL